MDFSKDRSGPENSFERIWVHRMNPVAEAEKPMGRIIRRML